MTSQRQHTANVFCFGLTTFRKLPPGLFGNALLLAHFTTLPHATDQTNPEVRDEVDNETVDDEGSSEEMPAGNSEKAAKEKEEQLEAEQTPMVEKGMHTVIGLSNYAWKDAEDFEISHKYFMQVPVFCTSPPLSYLTLLTY